MKLYFLLLLSTFIRVVSAQSGGGQLAGNATVCSVSNSGSLSVTNYTGNIQRWEFSSSINGPWSVMAHTFAVYSYVNLNQTTWFRVVVQNGAFVPAYSNAVCVTVVSPAVGQLVTTASNVCTGSSVSLSLTNLSGTPVSWLYSTDNWITTATLASSGPSVIVSPTVNIHYQAVLQQSPCAIVTTNTVSISVYTPVVTGSITAPLSVCNGASVNLSVNTSSVNVVGWESAMNANQSFQGWNTTAGMTNFSLTLQNSMCFRVRQGNGICPDVYTAPVCVSVQPLAQGGIITGPSTLCVNGGTVGLQLTGYVGTITNWERQLLGNNTWTPIASSSSTLFVSSVQSSTNYRAIIAAGSCPTATSSIHTLTVYTLPQLSISIAPVCEGRTVQPVNSSSNCVNYIWRSTTGSAWLGSSPVLQPNGTGIQTITVVGISAQGCQDSIYVNVQVYSKPVVLLSAPDTACALQLLQHSHNSYVPFSSVVGSTLSFGDGYSTTSLPALHSYSTGGFFIRKLKVQSQQGCIDSIAKGIVISVLNPPTLHYQGACNQQPIQFSSSHSTVSAYWQFGDGGTATGVNPTHLYALAGNYTVSLYITDGICSAITATPLVISTTPSVTIAPASGCVNAGIFLSANVQPSFATCAWKTSDGTTSAQSAFMHTFTVAGFYPTTLTVTTSPQCSVTASTINSVYPVPLVTWSPSPVCMGDSIHLQMNGTSDLLRWIVSHEDTLTGNNKWYAPERSGFISIHLQVTNKWGCTAYHEDSVVVRNAPQAQFSVPAVCEYDTARVYNQTQFSSTAPPTFRWLFSDGWESSIFQPHRQLRPGKYWVQLVATNAEGCRNERSDTLLVHAQPIAAFSVSNVCMGDTVVFENRSQGTHFIQEYKWYTADTLYSTRYTPVWQPHSAGTSNWKLIIKDVNGCYGMAKETIVIHAPLKVASLHDTLISLGQSLHVDFSMFKEVFWLSVAAFVNPIAKEQWIRPQQSTCFAVRLHDSMGCVQTHSFCIQVEQSYDIHPYELVTADGNGLNDVWLVENIELYPDNSIELVDHRGVLVYSERNYQNTWDGKNLKGELLPEGMYYYQIKFENSRKVFKGYVCLLR